MRSQHRVAVVYPFFPHYREPILRELRVSGRHDYVFVGDTSHWKKSIEAADVSEWKEFVKAPCRLIGGRILIQKGLVSIALRRDVDTVIYHGGLNWPSMWMLALLCRMSGKRVMNWTHGWVHPETGVRRWAKHVLYRYLADALLLYGHFASSRSDSCSRHRTRKNSRCLQQSRCR